MAQQSLPALRVQAMSDDDPMVAHALGLCRRPDPAGVSGQCRQDPVQGQRRPQGRQHRSRSHPCHVARSSRRHDCGGDRRPLRLLRARHRHQGSARRRRPCHCKEARSILYRWCRGADAIRRLARLVPNRRPGIAVKERADRSRSRFQGRRRLCRAAAEPARSDKGRLSMGERQRPFGSHRSAGRDRCGAQANTP